jgi:N-acetylmuramoyl-L-alanine amidase
MKSRSSFAWSIPALALLLLLSGCASHRPGPSAPMAAPSTGSLDSRLAALNVRQTLLPPNVHGRLINRTMQPRYLTIHSTENRGGTAEMHARYLLGSGKRSKNNPRFGRSGWVTWHFTVDDHEAVQHLLPTEQGDHADYGGPGDRESIGIEICEFGDPARQAGAIDRAARVAAVLADYYRIPQSNIVPHMHWPRWDYQYGKPCPHILLERDRSAPGGWRLGAKWDGFIAQVGRYR